MCGDSLRPCTAIPGARRERDPPGADRELQRRAPWAVSASRPVTGSRTDGPGMAAYVLGPGHLRALDDRTHER